MTRIVKVTPQLASEWLKRNTMNRKLDRNIVRQYAEIMADGRFYLNGDTIRFADDGTLLDGQHRLAAVIQANVEVTMEVREGLSKDAMPTIDVGKKRSTPDILKILGRSETAKLSSAITWANFFINADGTTQPMTLHRDSVLSAMDQDRFLRINPDIADFVRHGTKLYEKFRALVPSMLMGFYFAASKIDKEAADEFCSGLATGAFMHEHDPRMALRRRLMQRKQTSKKEPISVIAVLHIYAWNAYRQSRLLKRLLYTPGDAVPTMI